MEMVGLKPGLRIDGFDRFGEALGVIREGCGHLEAEVFELLQKLLGIVSILRRRFMGHQDAVMLILHDHNTMVSPYGFLSVNFSFLRRGEHKQVPKHLLWRGQMRTNIINPAFDRRFGNGNPEERCKEERNMPEADPTDHREVAGQPDHAVAHMLRGRDALDGWGEVYPLVLAIQIGTLG